MTNVSEWLYDEFVQVGVDYESPEEVEEYDKLHAHFRDHKQESDHILDKIGVGSDDALIDFGSGTGTFAIQAAKRCQVVHGVDVSKPMIEYAREKVRTSNIRNIEFHHAGFLTYEHKGDPVESIVSVYALHHLPDFWKSEALKRMYSMLAPEGQFYLQDIVVPDCEPIDAVNDFITSQERKGGESLKNDAECHFSEEYSTYGWIMEGLLKRAGFKVEEQERVDGVIGKYLCRKESR